MSSLGGRRSSTGSSALVERASVGRGEPVELEHRGRGLRDVGERHRFLVDTGLHDARPVQQQRHVLGVVERRRVSESRRHVVGERRDHLQVAAASQVRAVHGAHEHLARHRLADLAREPVGGDRRLIGSSGRHGRRRRAGDRSGGAARARAVRGRPCERHARDRDERGDRDHHRSTAPEGCGGGHRGTRVPRHLATAGRCPGVSGAARILPVAVLGGELAVPCTRDPLQRG